MSDSIAPENPSNISIRAVNSTDSSLLLAWRNHSEVRRWSRDLREIDVDTHEVSNLIEPGFQGRGIAKGATAAAIREIGSKLSNFTILASVHEKNTPSVKLFTNLGFQECGKSGDFLDFFRNFHFENF